MIIGSRPVLKTGARKRVGGSSPSASAKFDSHNKSYFVAHLVEQNYFKIWVDGSIPSEAHNVYYFYYFSSNFICRVSIMVIMPVFQTGHGSSILLPCSHF